MNRLPEDCISHVISFTTPRDSCRSSVISAAFRSAAASESVWERFLPSDYRDIISRAVDPVILSSKKELYFRLCDSLLIDGGKVSFALEKSSGNKCFMLSARELLIVWGETPQYWRWISLSDSRFSQVAELLDVCWLEIRSKIDARVLSPKTTYAAYLVFRDVHGSFGLSSPGQETSVMIGAHVCRRTVCLKPDDREMQRHAAVQQYLMNWRQDHPEVFRSVMATKEIIGAGRFPQARKDGWMEVEMGGFFIDDGNEGEVDMSLMEVKRRHQKKGLIIQGIEVRPKK